MSTSRPRLLDLYCGAGGAAVGYHRAGFDIVGVDREPQPDYPFTFVEGDALEYAGRHAADFAAVHGSPPCQTHSALTKGNRARGWVDTHVDMIEATRSLLDAAGRPYVLENVEGSPLRRDLILCGLQFGLRVFRHRYIELGGWSVEEPLRCTGRAGRGAHRGYRVAGWRHGVRYEGNLVAPYGHGGSKGTPREWAEAMGITWTLNRHSLAEAIPPSYTEWIGVRLLAAVGGGEPPLRLLIIYRWRSPSRVPDDRSSSAHDGCRQRSTRAGNSRRSGPARASRRWGPGRRRIPRPPVGV